MPLPAWHERCMLREDVRNGHLELYEFAADLNLVRQKKAPPIYQEPEAFFTRTYPSSQLKLLVRQVARRLQDLPDGKPVIRMQVAYGGGKTHTLIALLHLAEQGMRLRDHATVGTFLTFADLAQPPRAQVALLPFDKFGFEEGLAVYDPEGHTRTVHTPWGTLAYQLGGDTGLSMVNDDRSAYIAPGEDRLADLLSLPQKRDGRGALILIDETLMYCRSAYNADPRTLGTLKDFFQKLTQAVARTAKCALVATLISSESERHDATGITILRELDAVFGRIEENIQPIERDDLPEVLRRRFFDHVPPVEERQSTVDAILAALQPLPMRDSQKGNEAERRFLDAYPFHPELLDVLYQKWTQVPNYQRTRGALRLLGLALQEAVDHDPSPQISPGTFLAYRAAQTSLSPAVAELIKATEAAEQWRPILEGELGRGRAAQSQYPALHSREVEQAVLSTFLHSQPRGKRADTADLLGLLAYSGVDRISLMEGLKAWRGLSWFLVEGDDTFWQLDFVPNLNQMHADAMDRVTTSAIDEELRHRVQAERTLTRTTNDVRAYNLPRSPRDVEDSPEFRYLVLGPECAVTPGQAVPPHVAAFFTDLSGPQNPRTYKNALVALAPERAKLDGVREQVRRWLAWGLVQKSRDAVRLSEAQQKKLARELDTLNAQIPSAVQGTWSVVVCIAGEGNRSGGMNLTAELLKINPGKQNATPFERIVFQLRESERLAPDQIDPELLLPESYLNLWRPDQTALNVADLANAFGQFARLPRLMHRGVLDRSLNQGVTAGKFVLRLVRSDGSVRTIWHQEASEGDLHRPELELVPITYAALISLDPMLLAPGALPELWPPSRDGELSMARMSAYFDGQHAPRLERREVLEQALRAAIKDGLVMARVGEEVYWHESVAPDLPFDDARLLPQPPVVHASDLGPVALASAWGSGGTTIGRLLEALTAKQGVLVPWPAIRDALMEGNRQGIFSVDTNALLVATPAERASIAVRPREISTLDTDAFIDTSVASIWQRGQARLREVKAAIEHSRGCTVPLPVFVRAAHQAAAEGKIALPENVTALANTEMLDLRVLPKKMHIATEAKLSLRALNDLPQAALQVTQIAPEMSFEFVVTISAEGDTLSTEQIRELNEVLTKVSPNLRLA